MTRHLDHSGDLNAASPSPPQLDLPRTYTWNRALPEVLRQETETLHSEIIRVVVIIIIIRVIIIITSFKTVYRLSQDSFLSPVPKLC